MSPRPAACPRASRLPAATSSRQASGAPAHADHGGEQPHARRCPFYNRAALLGGAPGRPATVRALEPGTALAATGGMRSLSRPEHLRSALAGVDCFIALRAGESITRPRVDLVAVVPSGSVARITRVDAGVVVPAAAGLRSVVSSR